MTIVLTLDDKQYNKAKFFQELRELAFDFNAVIETMVWTPSATQDQSIPDIRLADGTVQATQDLITAAATAHDHTALTDSQSSSQAYRAMKADNSTTALMWADLKTVNDTLEAHANADTLTLANSYTAYRTAFDGLSVPLQALAGRYMVGHSPTGFTIVEPGTLDDDYRHSFVQASWMFWMYVAARRI